MINCKRLLFSETRYVLLIIIPVILFFLYLSVGRYDVPVSHIITGNYSSNFEQIAVINIRLPRAIIAACFGAVMAISGASLQTVLRNPLVSPYILGISSGAAFGAALSMALMGTGLTLMIQPCAIFFGLLAIGLSLGVACIRGEISPISVVLGGVIVSALFSGFLSLVQIIVEPEKAQAVIAWMAGRLNTISWNDVYQGLPLSVISIAALLIMRWRLFALSMGDEEAKSLGISVNRERLICILFACIGTAAIVSICGVIGWVCLISPHITRFIFGSHPALLLPASISVGISFMLVADLISRTIWEFEIPVGIITTIIGAPLFLYLMRKNIYEWHH